MDLSPAGSCIVLFRAGFFCFAPKSPAKLAAVVRNLRIEVFTSSARRRSRSEGPPALDKDVARASFCVEDERNSELLRKAWVTNEER